MLTKTEQEEEREYMRRGQIFGYKGECKSLNNFINSSFFINAGCKEEKINRFFYALMLSDRRFDMSLECTERMMIMFIAGYLSVVIPKRQEK